eukprot:NODE_2903_length_1017_cov_643.847107_g2428_i0.p2 GENE.NODE_2903_length_1017_cov_643.847107_g2428_i0~~NODE_2903_length_1017_cov_643.847107_g2428_i0.p2  ORF type:complete len:260 (+),score=73.11 NODE_2903_length_1017_cov_643.847107_g2428_i0:116-895(+)
MGKVPLTRRKGGGGVFAASVHKRAGGTKLRAQDYSERNGYIRGLVKEIFHESGRGAPMMRVQFRHPFKYKRVTEQMVCPEGVHQGQFVYFGKKAQLAIGNVLPIKAMPEGSIVCNVESKRGDRGCLARASGDYCTVISHNADTGRSRIRLPSGQKKSVQSACRAMVGIVSGGGRIEKPLLKAGNNYFRFKKKRNAWPRVRGVARNPVEHPHGGGNHQHIGHSSAVRRSAPPGQKVGLIAARRTGRIRGASKLALMGHGD